MDNVLFALSENDTIYDEIIKTNINDRRLVLNKEISTDLIEEFTLWIIRWNQEDRDIPKDKRKNIYIYLNTDGGDIMFGLSMLDIIQTSETPIICVVLSAANSMGSYIPMVCSESLAFPHSIICIHDGEVGIQQTTRKANDTYKFVTNCLDNLSKIALEHTNMDKEFLEEIADREYYIFADKAKELGIMDKIIGIDVPLSYIFQ